MGTWRMIPMNCWFSHWHCFCFWRKSVLDWYMRAVDTLERLLWTCLVGITAPFLLSEDKRLEKTADRPPYGMLPRQKSTWARRCSNESATVRWWCRKLISVAPSWWQALDILNSCLINHVKNKYPHGALNRAGSTSITCLLTGRQRICIEKIVCAGVWHLMLSLPTKPHSGIYERVLHQCTEIITD